VRKYTRQCHRNHHDLSAVRQPRIGLTIFLLTMVVLGTASCSNPKAMDVVWSQDGVDDNGFARNPVWYQAKQSGQPPNACTFCPCGTEDPPAWKGATNCTDQTLETNSSFECFGHWNWFPVEYEGTVTWGGHSNSVYDDDDYYFDIARDDQALQTDGGNGARPLHLEFNSEQTVDYWDDTNTWWDDFHHNAVDKASWLFSDDHYAHDYVDGKYAIVIGQLGLDSWHDVPAELNPVYAMFVHVQDDATQDRWAFFVKNWGDEGYCGDNEENLDRRKIQVRIPHPWGATGFSLSDNVYVYGDDEDERNQQSWTYQPVKDGVLLTFWLRDPTKQVGFVGDLTINWGGTILAQKGAGRSAQHAEPHISKSRKSRVQPAEEDGDKLLKATIDKLNPSAQKLLHQQLKNLVHHPKCQTKKGTKDTSPVTERVRPAGTRPDYGTVVKSVADPARRARKTRDRAFILSFLKAHGIE
jgi:hypothetical protein